MAKVINKAKGVHKPKQATAIMSKRGLYLFYIGLVFIGIGFILMAQPPVDGFMSRTLAPLVLVFSYLILIPISLFMKDKKASE